MTIHFCSYYDLQLQYEYSIKLQITVYYLLGYICKRNTVKYKLKKLLKDLLLNLNYS